ncbi:MAG: hypothetical protein ACRC80_20940 [Waterburya sp.]
MSNIPISKARNLRSPQIMSAVVPCSLLAAAIQGGLTVKLRSLQALATGSDTFDGDDSRVMVNGEILFSADGVLPGNTFQIDKKIVVGNLADIEIFDADGGLKGGDDPIESMQFSTHFPISHIFKNKHSSYLLKGEILP